MAIARDRETALLVLGDLHYGKATASYDPVTFERRMDRLAGQLIRWNDRLSPSTVFDDGLLVTLVGDTVDGNDIFPGQATEQRIGNVEEQARYFAEYMAPWLKAQADVWGSARVEAIPGNHGRSGRYAHEAASWDVVAHRYLKMQAEPLGVPVRFNDTPVDPFMRAIKVRSHDVLLYHGHEWGRTIKSRATRVYEWNAVYQKFFRLVLSGHFHGTENFQMNHCELFQTGTIISGDNHSIRKYGAVGEPKCWLLTVSDDEVPSFCKKLSFDLGVRHGTV